MDKLSILEELKGYTESEIIAMYEDYGRMSEELRAYNEKIADGRLMAEWIKVNSLGRRCSNCNTVTVIEQHKSVDNCPNCGAKMRGSD